MPPTDAAQPDLTRWGQAWRLALCLLVSAVAWPQYATAQWREDRGLFWLDLVLGVLALVAVLWRRRRPLLVAVVLNAASAVSGAAAGPATLALVSLATRRRAAPVALAAAVSLAAGIVYATTAPFDGQRVLWVDLGANVVAVAAMVVFGLYIGSRRELLWTLRQRAERAEAEQELRASRARDAERARIAREMHDVLAHRITQISLHAGAMAYRDDLDAAQLRHQSEVVAGAAHEALQDLRAVLGVLRDEETGAALERPQPTWDDLGELIDRARAAGQRVEVSIEVSGAEPVPTAVGRAVYRIVQEGLTNAGRHSPGALLDVDLAGGPEDGLSVVLRNPRGFARRESQGAGLGLVGLTERATLRGGWLRAQERDEVFELRAWLPWTAA